MEAEQKQIEGKFFLKCRTHIESYTWFVSIHSSCSKARFSQVNFCQVICHKLMLSKNAIKMQTKLYKNGKKLCNVCLQIICRNLDNIFQSSQSQVYYGWVIFDKLTLHFNELMYCRIRMERRILLQDFYEYNEWHGSGWVAN